MVTPGTGVIYTLAAGLSRGARAGIVAALGCTLGIVPHMLAAVTGVAALLETSAAAFSVLKYAGVAYLLYMAWTMARDRSELSVVRAAASPSAAKVIVEAILINILNPKLTLFFFAFLPQFVSASVPDALGRMLGLSGVFMLVTLVVFVGYGILAAALRARVIAQPRILVLLRRVFAGSFVVLSARLALTNR